MFGEYFYVMPVDDQWEVRAPNKLDLQVFPTETQAVEAALSGALLARQANGLAPAVRVRSIAGSWRQVDVEGSVTPITSF